MTEKSIYQPSNKHLIIFIAMLMALVFQTIYDAFVNSLSLLWITFFLLMLIVVLYLKMRENKHPLILDEIGLQLNSLTKIGKTNKVAWDDIESIIKINRRGYSMLLIKVKDRTWSSKINKIKNLTYDFTISEDHFNDPNEEIYKKIRHMHQIKNITL